MDDDDDGAMNDNDYIKQKEAKRNKEMKERAKILKDPERISEELDRLNKKSFLTDSDNDYKRMLLQAQQTIEEKKNAVSFSFNVFELRNQSLKKQKIGDHEALNPSSVSFPQDAILAQANDGRLLPVGGVGGVPLPPPKQEKRSDVILPKPPSYPPPIYGEKNLPPPPFDQRILQFPPPPPPIPLPPLPIQAIPIPPKLQTTNDTDIQSSNEKSEAFDEGNKPSHIPTKFLKFIPTIVKHQKQSAPSIANKLELPPVTQNNSNTSTNSNRKPLLPPPINDKNY